MLCIASKLPQNVSKNRFKDVTACESITFSTTTRGIFCSAMRTSLSLIYNRLGFVFIMNYRIARNFRGRKFHEFRDLQAIRENIILKCLVFVDKDGGNSADSRNALSCAFAKISRYTVLVIVLLVGRKFCIMVDGVTLQEIPIFTAVSLLFICLYLSDDLTRVHLLDGPVDYINANNVNVCHILHYY